MDPIDLPVWSILTALFMWVVVSSLPSAVPLAVAASVVARRRGASIWAWGAAGLVAGFALPGVTSLVGYWVQGGLLPVGTVVTWVPAWVATAVLILSAAATRRGARRDGPR